MKIKQKSKRTGAYSLINSLVQHGVEHIFGYPGGAILPIYDEIFHWEKNGFLKHILVRHEQSAAHAADAYSRATQKVGVCFATSGPGATNLVTGIATAKMDSIPMIIITGQVSTNLIGTDAFQETNICSITSDIVKKSYQVKSAQDLEKIIKEAFIIAQNGRPGPVLVDIPKDVGLEEIITCDKLEAKTFNYERKIIKKSLAKLSLNYLNQSKQTLFYLGGGLGTSKAYKILSFLSKLFLIPQSQTLMGKSYSNENDIFHLGMLGMHGTAYANFAVSECDLLLACGVRFDDRVTGKLEEFAYYGEVIHCDIDRKEIQKNKYCQLNFLSDLRFFLRILSAFARFNFSKNNLNRKASWLKKIFKWKKSYALNYLESNTSTLSTPKILSLLNKKTWDSIITTDVGQHQMWSAQCLKIKPKCWLSSSGLGTMGYGLPASIGAKVAQQSKNVICISGDSSFQMNLQELACLSQYKLQINIFLVNNGWQGMVRQWQESFYGKRFSNSYMGHNSPCFRKLAEAYDLEYILIDSEEKFLKIINEKDILLKSILFEIKVSEGENCYPMISPGKSNKEMIGLSPDSYANQII